ncbi:MAG: hypothetical protein ABIT10_06810 [Alteraurantiacibacter sp.]
MMRRLAASLFAFVALALPAHAQDTTPVPPPAPPPQLSLEQRMILRCSAAFALVANRQQSGESWALDYPPLATRGREFFVRGTAQLSDETGADVSAFAPLLRAEAENLLDRPLLLQVMPVCLTLLPPEPTG